MTLHATFAAQTLLATPRATGESFAQTARSATARSATARSATTLPASALPASTLPHISSVHKALPYHRIGGRTRAPKPRQQFIYRARGLTASIATFRTRLTDLAEDGAHAQSVNAFELFRERDSLAHLGYDYS